MKLARLNAIGVALEAWFPTVRRMLDPEPLGCVVAIADGTPGFVSYLDIYDVESTVSRVRLRGDCEDCLIHLNGNPFAVINEGDEDIRVRYGGAIRCDNGNVIVVKGLGNVKLEEAFAAAAAVTSGDIVEKKSLGPDSNCRQKSLHVPLREA
jgi:hypothetical protein